MRQSHTVLERNHSLHLYPQHDLPDEYFEVQRISYERAGVKVLRAGNQHISNTPPTETAFRGNALRGNLAVATWRDYRKTDPPALDSTENGWYRPEGRATVSPTIAVALLLSFRPSSSFC